MTKIKWSHSSLKQFETCQRQYHEIKVLKKWPFEQGEQALYGENLHLAAELYVKDGTPIPPEFAFIKPTVDALLSKKGTKYPEHEMALDEQLNVVDWKDPTVWVRGIADLLIIDEEDGIAWCIDYKTGSDRYPDTNQLDLMSLMIFKHFPEIQEVRSALLFVVKNSMTKHLVKRDQEEALWWKYRERVARIAECMDTDVWRPKQSGLCKKYCAVLTCEYNGRT